MDLLPETHDDSSILATCKIIPELYLGKWGRVIKEQFYISMSTAFMFGSGWEVGANHLILSLFFNPNFPKPSLTQPVTEI